MSKKLRKYLSLAPRFLASVTGKAGVIGYVEHLEPTSIHGWAINRKGKPIQFVLSVDGQHFPLAATWNDRTDVAGQHGPQYIQSGFRSTPSADASAALKKALRQGLPIKVLAGRVALGMVAKLPALAVQLSTEKLGVKTDKPGLKGEIENWGNFTLRGWAAVNECASKSITLIRNGEALDCVVIPGNRQDIARQLGIPANRIFGFQFVELARRGAELRNQLLVQYPASSGIVHDAYVRFLWDLMQFYRQLHGTWFDKHTMRVAQEDWVVHRLVSTCEKPNWQLLFSLTAIGVDTSNVDPMKEVFWRRSLPRTHELAPGCLSHPACPVPAGIIKAIEVEAGLALPKDATIKVSKSNE